jgi:RNA polymerase sigma factor (sigma-70 family)
MSADTAATAVGMRPRLVGFIRSRVSSAEDAEDIAQEVFYQLARMDSIARPVEHVSAWLYQAARNHIINWRKKKREEPYPEYYDEDDDMFRDFADILFCNESTPESEYLRSLVWEEIEAALAELPVEQRDIFEKTEFLGLAVKDIAEAEGVPVNTLLSRKHYAVVRLRKRLSDLYEDIVAM